ncbi:hypothetical protein ANTPLA_LOCUS768 [Anthophora plagiata]
MISEDYVYLIRKATTVHSHAPPIEFPAVFTCSTCSKLKARGSRTECAVARFMGGRSLGQGKENRLCYKSAGECKVQWIVDLPICIFGTSFCPSSGRSSSCHEIPFTNRLVL